MTENQISRYITDAAIEVHRTLGGPGLLEGVYEEAMAWELQKAGLLVERQKKSKDQITLPLYKSFEPLFLCPFVLKSLSGLIPLTWIHKTIPLADSSAGKR